MAKFKNLITETGSFLFDEMNYQFNGAFETNDKKIIAHLESRSDWELIKEEKKISKTDNVVESVDINEIDLNTQTKTFLIDLATSLKLPVEGLTKAQLIEAIEASKNENDNL